MFVQRARKVKLHYFGVLFLDLGKQEHIPGFPLKHVNDISVRKNMLP